MKTKNLFLFVAVLCLCWGSQGLAQWITQPDTINIPGKYLVGCDIDGIIVFEEGSNGSILDGKGYNVRMVSVEKVNNIEIHNCVIGGDFGGTSGVRVKESNNIFVHHNIISNHSFYGVLLDSSCSNTISHNLISGGGYYGIGLASHSSDNMLNSNEIQRHQLYGIVLQDSSNYNKIISCDISDESSGIVMHRVDSNTVISNTISDSHLGIQLYISNFNTIKYNTIWNIKSWDGILINSSKDNELSYNKNCGDIINIKRYGININIYEGIVSTGNFGEKNVLIGFDGNYGCNINGNNIGIITSVSSEENIVSDFTLSQNYPNPFNPKTTISFSLPKSEFVTLDVYNLLGKKVKTLIRNKKMLPGNHSVNFNGSEFPTGTYIYKIQAGDFVETKKMTLLK